MPSLDLDVALVPSVLGPDSLKGRAAVVIDVLRMSSTVVTALANGARTILPAADLGEAGRLRATLDPAHSVLGGERDGVAVDGFDVGNSPAEYDAATVGGKSVVITTTNGTRALALAKAARRAAVGCFLNAARTAAWAREALADGLGVTLVCAGSDGRVAMEDVLCAGYLAHHIAGGADTAGLRDGVQIALALYAGAGGRLAPALMRAHHTQRLIALGFADDVSACARIDSHDLLPVLRDGRLTAV